MVISHRYKYLFVELPHTGSTAVNRELRANYEGVNIILKHATYADFSRIANAEEKTYFVFSNIRNPLDEAVSIFFKFRTDHRKRFSQRKIKSRAFRYISEKRFRFIQDTDADFATYFMRFHRVPYDNWSSLSHKKFDYVMRFERLQDDFERVLELLGIEQKRPLPVINKTGQKRRDFLSYYTPETIGRAKWVFGPFMREWGYAFPAEWGDESVPRSSQILYRFCGIFRALYWKHLRFKAPGF